MTHTTKHTPLHKAVHVIPMLYAEAFAGSNNKEFVVDLYKDARLLETAAPAMYEALRQALTTIEQTLSIIERNKIRDNVLNALAQAEGKH